ncbi:MAG: ABC transporter permease [Mariprofundaceae bacterium]|nr:ABC transporter permease [Mariprofundaceae bacterium]
MLSMAWRNIIRNIRRSMITMAAITIGLASLLFLWAFNDGIHNNMTRNMQDSIVGSIQIHQQGYFRSPRLSRYIHQPQQVLTALHQAGVDDYASELQDFALAAGDDVSEGLVLVGVNPDHTLLTMPNKVDQGRWLRSDDDTACILGATSARNLGLHLGDDVVLLTEDRFGSLAAEKFTLVGIISSGEMGIDRGLAVIPLPFMQRWLGMEGRVSRILIQLPSERLEATYEALNAALSHENYEVMRWYDMYPMMQQWVELENVFYYIFLGVVLLIVGAGVMNTVLMSMLERVHEFGVMLALGCSRFSLAGMVLIESVMLGACGVIIGTVLGLSLVAWFHRVGIDLSGQMETIQRFYIDPVVHTEINTDHLLHTVTLVLLAALLAAIVPAWRVARLQPVDAIHHL